MRVEETVGRRVREARERVGMSQRELGQHIAPLLGRVLSRQSISQAEQGHRAFSAVDLVMFANVLDVDAAFLLSIPPAVEQIEMPSGHALYRKDLLRARQADTEGIRAATAKLVALTKSVQDGGRQAEEIARDLYEDWARALTGAGGDG